MPQAPSSAANGTAAADIATNAASFARHLARRQQSPEHDQGLPRATERFDLFLEAKGMPRSVAHIHREHVEAFIEDQLARLKPASAANRYRSLQQFFRWLVKEGDLRESAMARMKPPAIPETPPPVLTDNQIRKLLAAMSGMGFDERRDTAITMLLVDTGIRLAEVSGLTVEDIDWEHETLIVLGKGRRPRTVAFGRKVARWVDQRRPPML